MQSRRLYRCRAYHPQLPEFLRLNTKHYHNIHNIRTIYRFKHITCIKVYIKTATSSKLAMVCISWLTLAHSATTAASDINGISNNNETDKALEDELATQFFLNACQQRPANPPISTTTSTTSSTSDVHHHNEHPSYAVIPQFHFRESVEDLVADPILSRCREEYRNLFLRRRSEKFLDIDELDILWLKLTEHSIKDMKEEHSIKIDNDVKTNNDSYDDKTIVQGGGDVDADDMHSGRIGYLGLQRVLSELPPKCYDAVASFLTASKFIKLLNMSPSPVTDGYVPIYQIFNYALKRVSLSQTRIGLSFFDPEGHGYLRETDLEAYMYELIPSLPQLERLEAGFRPFYVLSAVRKFFFFLDPNRKGKIRIQDMLSSSILSELFELREADLHGDLEASNWFSATTALRIYRQYLRLDVDHNGMLSQQELSKYGTGTLTTVFLNRIFEECHTYDGEMDYKTYLDFVLAMENPTMPQSLQYFFRLLDMKCLGYLHVFSLNYFYKAIQEQMRLAGQDVVDFADVKDEIFDMIKPKHPYHITQADLINSGNGTTVISILSDTKAFWTYDNRESLMAEGPDNNDVEE